MVMGVFKKTVVSGGTGASASLTDRLVSDSGASGTRVAGYRLTAAGQVQTKLFSSAYANVGETWMLTLTGSSYDVRATVTSGTVTTGTTGTWTNLAADQDWTVSQGSVGIHDTFLTIEIRDAVTLAVLTSATIELSAERT